jgi:uncharacterized protein
VTLWLVDTNVVCAGLITSDAKSPTASIVGRMLAGQMRHAVSLALLAEYEGVLARPSLRRLHRLDAEQLEILVAGLGRHAVLVEAPAAKLQAPDPGDQFLWNALVDDPRLRLITADKRLLQADAMKGRVITPAQALASEA